MKKASLFLSLILTVGCTPSPQSSNDKAGLDDLFKEISDKADNFGGMFISDEGLNVYLTDSGDSKAQVQAAIADVFENDQSIKAQATKIKYLRARYSFSQLKTWSDRLVNLLGTEIVRTDIDETANKLRIGVAEGQSLDPQKLKGLGIPLEAVIIEESEAIIPLASLRESVRPLSGGLQISFPGYLCTMGFTAVRQGVTGFVTNSHCTAKQGALDSTKYGQPSNLSFIGTEIVDPAYFQGAPCPGGKICRYSDSAFIRLDPGVETTVGLISQPDNLGLLNIAQNFRITSEATSNTLVGEVVNKVGRSTGWTQGKVIASCVNTSVPGTNMVHLCQNFVSAGSSSGDSGSPVFKITGGSNVELQGLLWGGNSTGTMFVYSPIINIQRDNELGNLSNCATGYTC